jgi:hypothetical protein
MSRNSPQGCGSNTSQPIRLDPISTRARSRQERRSVTAYGTASYLIEVGVTHFVDQEKLAVLRGLGNPSIEIDLRRFDRESWDWGALDEIVVHGTEAKHWLFCPEQRALIEMATEQARAVAEALPLPTPLQPLPKAKPPRTRYWPDNRIVDLIDFPFGVALWSPYDAQFNEVVKTWCRDFGGGGSVPTRTGSFQSKPSRSWSPRSPSARRVRPSRGHSL